MHDISNEQKAHDLAVVYTMHSAAQSNEAVSLEGFYLEYKDAYRLLLKMIKENN